MSDNQVPPTPAGEPDRSGPALQPTDLAGDRISPTGKRVGKVAREYATRKATLAKAEAEREAAAAKVRSADVPPRGTALIEVNGIGKSYGSVIALRDITTRVRAGEVTCVLGDNGAGKSTFIKIMAGAHPHSEGELIVDGTPRHFSNPRQALSEGIATVYQDLAVVPLMPVWRNFFLGSEPVKGKGPFKHLDVDFMRKTTKAELLAMGIDLRDVDQPIGTLSGGERQCVAIARAVYFGAKVLILDEPTAALGVKQSGVVLRYIAKARERGLGVVFITHNPHHAYPIGDRFLLLRRGRSMGEYEKDQITRDELITLMAGGAELEALSHELERSDIELDEPIAPEEA
ncbi:ATP-binding cassette domain-containing protein [Nocardioides sp.]|uniref:ATP-binding cassette domain-containing protein n=1 Tax=Nocardioides sp. TaxID=35761 RepID=UPI00261D0C15|nr:ATP-binding cassette domain-containing protein [Nocardioides sp.]